MVAGVISFVLFISLLPTEPSEILGEDPVDALQKMVDDRALWLVAHIFGAFAIPLIVVGQCALTRSIETAWGRAALTTAVVGMAVFLVLIGTNGFGIRGVAVLWDNNPQQQESLILVAQAIESVLSGLWGMTLSLVVGVPIVLYGVAILASNAYPRWIGWPAIVIGLGGTALGLAVAWEGALAKSPNDELDGFFVFVPLTGVWLLVMAVLLWRKSPAAAR